MLASTKNLAGDTTDTDSGRSSPPTAVAFMPDDPSSIPNKSTLTLNSNIIYNAITLTDTAFVDSGHPSTEVASLAGSAPASEVCNQGEDTDLSIDGNKKVELIDERKDSEKKPTTLLLKESSVKDDESNDDPDSLRIRFLKWAASLDEAKNVYRIYGVLNGLNDAYMSSRFVCDIIAGIGEKHRQASDVMHEWMTSDVGIVVSIAEGLLLVALSFIANSSDRDSKNEHIAKRYIAILMPYFREALKGLRYSFRSIKSVMQISFVLGGANLRSILIPAGLAMGVLSSITRIWHRQMYQERKDAAKFNLKLISNVNKKLLSKIDDKWVEESLKAIKGQLPSLQLKSLVVVGLCGVFDSVYQYMGMLAFAAVSPQVFVAMFVVCMFYALLNIVTRVYEEYDYQCKQQETEIQAELAIRGKDIDALLAKCMPEHSEENIKLLLEKLEAFNALCERLHKLANYSDSGAVLTGLKLGLTAYSVVTSLYFAVGTFTTLFGVAMPPVILMLGVFSGLLCLATHAYMTWKENKDQCVELANHKKDHQSLQLNIDKDTLKTKDIKKYLKHPQTLAVWNPMRVQDMYDVPRQGFSGVNKARQVVEFVGVGMQEVDSHGHYQNTQEMGVATAIASSAYIASFVTRAAARKAKQLLKLSEQGASSRGMFAPVPKLSPARKFQVDNGFPSSPH